MRYFYLYLSLLMCLTGEMTLEKQIPGSASHFLMASKTAGTQMEMGLTHHS